MSSVNKSPKVSAIVSTYNSEVFIGGCLTDLTSQTLFEEGELEIVVVNSGSTQNERAVVEKFQSAFENITYIETDERESLYQAWNRGIKLAKGEYVTNANTDDRHRKDALGLLSGYLNGHPDIDLVYSDCYVSTRANQTYDENDHSRVYRYPEYFPPESLLHFQFGIHPMWRKSVHDQIGYFDESYRVAGDYDFNLRFAASLHAKHIPEVFGLYYLSPQTVSFQGNGMENENRRIYQAYRTQEYILTLYANAGWETITPPQKAAVLNDMGIHAMSFSSAWEEGKKTRDVPFAQECFLAALNHQKYYQPSLNNLAVCLMLNGRTEDGQRLLQLADQLSGHKLITENLSSLSQKNGSGTNNFHLIRQQ